MTEIYNAILFDPLLNLLIGVYNALPWKDMGVVIIIVTVIIRFILYPLSNKAIKAQKALQDLQPEMEKIKNKYKDDKEKQSKALMEFYKEKKINPMSSCLPMLIQLPIIFALYQVFRLGLNLEESSKHLYSFVSEPESINNMMFGAIDLSTPNTILAVFAGIFQFIQSWMIMSRNKKRKQPSGKTANIMNNMTKQMTYFMPVLTVFIAMSIPSALAIYWITTTLFTIAQQAIITRKS